MKPYLPTSAEKLGTFPQGVGVPVGQVVPDVHAKNIDGVDVSLASLYAKSAVLLVFYRGGWCPYCNFEIFNLSKAFPDFQARGVMPVAVSVDRAEAAAKTGATYTVPFPLLADPDLAFHRGFHVARHVDDAELAQLKGYGIDLEAASGRDHHEIAIPALFLIDQGGVVRWAHADLDYKMRPSVQQILAAIAAAKLDR